MIEGFLWCVASGFLFGVISCLTNKCRIGPRRAGGPRGGRRPAARNGPLNGGLNERQPPGTNPGGLSRLTAPGGPLADGGARDRATGPAELGGAPGGRRGPRARSRGAGRPAAGGPRRGAPGPRFPAELGAETAAGGGAGSRAIEPPAGGNPRPAELGAEPPAPGSRPARQNPSSDLTTSRTCRMMECQATQHTNNGAGTMGLYVFKIAFAVVVSAMVINEIHHAFSVVTAALTF